MVGETVGFCIIKKGSKTGITPGNISDFEGKPIRVLEFGHDDCVLVLNNQATAIATFDKEDVEHKFKCSTVNMGGVSIICPPKEDNSFGILGVEIGNMMYANKCIARKGGYNNVVSNMVIMASLHSKKFNDNFLWQNQ